jgi:hypothetical protein
MPYIKKAELIEGVVYVPSPVRSASHAKPHGVMITWLGTYAAATPGVELNDNATVRLDLDNEPQPDALLRLEERLGGHSRLSPDDYIEGGPELIAEIAASSAAYDLHDKLRAYRRNQVQEYSSGKCTSTVSTGGAFRKVPMCHCRQIRGVLCAAWCFPGYGWPRQHYSQGIWQKCWQYYKQAWQRLSTEPSSSS